jgi:hypothetical protein
MTTKINYTTPIRSNILYRNGDLVKDLLNFITTKNRHGYDLLVPQCFGINTKTVNKLTQVLYNNFPGLSVNTELFISNNKNYGHTQFIEINNTYNKNLNKIIFANMVCIKNTKNKRKIDYISLARCLSDVSVFIKQKLSNAENDKIQIISSRFGTGFLGGNWSFIEQLVNDSWDSFTTTIYHYDNETTH